MNNAKNLMTCAERSNKIFGYSLEENQNGSDT